jgi:hypothetical protein
MSKIFRRQAPGPQFKAKGRGKGKGVRGWSIPPNKILRVQYWFQSACPKSESLTIESESSSGESESRKSGTQVQSPIIASLSMARWNPTAPPLFYCIIVVEGVVLSAGTGFDGSSDGKFPEISQLET